MANHRMTIRCKLAAGVAAGALLASAAPALADERGAASLLPAAGAAAAGSAVIEERQSYALRLMTQIFDGREDFSHTQLLGVGRVRKGNRSVTQYDYGDGAVVIRESDGGLAAGRFLNVTPAEKGVIYNYDTHTMQGNSAITIFHNDVIRPLLNRGPALGSDASWTSQVPLASLGLNSISGGDVTIKLEREYFTFHGKPMVLVHYAIPAFVYESESGQKLVHWAHGISLTDPGFGMIYLNSALHRSVAQQEGLASTPYRYARTMVAANPDGSAMIDYREVPQLREHIDKLFSSDAMRVVPPSGPAAQPSNTPIELAALLDRIGFTLGENGANQSGSATAAQQEGDNVTVLGTLNAAASRVNQLGQAIGVTKAGTAVIGTTQAVAEIVSMAESLLAKQARIASEVQTISTKLNALNDVLKSVPLVPEYTPQVTKLQTQQSNLGKMMFAVEERLDRLANQIDDLETSGKPVPAHLLTEFDDTLDTQRDLFGRMKGVTESLETSFSTGDGVKMVPDMTNPTAVRALREIEELKQSRSLLELASQDLGKSGIVIMQKLANSNKAVFEALEAFSNSPVGKVLDKLAHVMNFVTGVKVVSNSYTAATTNIGAGDLPLTRDYGYDGWDATLTLGLDILGMGANALTLNVPAFWSDFAALTFGTFSDTVIAYKGISDVEKLILQAEKDALYIQEQETRRVEKRMRDFDARWAGRPSSLGDIIAGTVDPYKDGYGLPPWPEGQEPPDVPPGDDPSTPTDTKPKQPTKPPVFAEPDPYPKADPVTPKEKSDEPRLEATVLTPAELWQIKVRGENAAAEEELKKYQEEKLAQLKAEGEESSLPGTYDFRTSTLETTELLVSTFDIEPVTFEPVEFKMPTFDLDEDLFVRNEDGTTSLKKVGPDDFVMTPMDAPEISMFPPTDPDDLDGYPGTGEYPSFGLDSISGTAMEPDLDKWAEWLEGQDLRLLEQLARGAGYPSLAFALEDAERIIRLSEDSGYRTYANRGPNCAGYTGCTGSVGPWKIAWATIRLGDILAESREIFSSGGFSDIGISGFNLAYLLRDFGVEDGDLIDVQISQFGRPISTIRGHFLTNAGNRFNVNLRPGVSQMVVTALNEGSLRPNTAQVSIDNVVRGEASQTYSLSTGETAVLRIESGVR
jgi:hypothetical protein